MFTAWWFPFSRFGVIHGDPHLGNYTVFERERQPAGINLLDYGCIRIFPPSFVGGVVDLYHGLLHGDDALVVHAYETWGFKRLNRELIDTLNIWARFIYGPLLDDRVRTIADGVKPSRIRPQARPFACIRRLRQRGPVTVPREFVFMDRAAIGLGGVFLHLAAELNFYRLFNEAIEDFGRPGRRAASGRARRQRACKAVRLKVESGSVALTGHNCANPCAPAFRATRRAPPWPTTATSNTRPPPAMIIAAHEQSYESFVHLRWSAFSTSSTILFGLATGGVMGHWFLAARFL